jgi:hypothetical protein
LIGSSAAVDVRIAHGADDDGVIDAYEPLHPDGPTDPDDDPRSYRPAWVDEDDEDVVRGRDSYLMTLDPDWEC